MCVCCVLCAVWVLCVLCFVVCCCVGAPPSPVYERTSGGLFYHHPSDLAHLQVLGEAVCAVYVRYACCVRDMCGLESTYN